MKNSVLGFLAFILIGAASSVHANNGLIRKVWTGISSNYITKLQADENYPDSPAFVDVLDSFDAPLNWADSYGTRIEGYIVPQASGAYTFWISTDDYGELHLSTDDTDEGLVKIAHINGWSSHKQFDKYTSQKSAPITLEAGQRYRVVALQKEGGGGDNLSVAWQGPSIPERVIIANEYLEAGDDVAIPSTPENLSVFASDSFVSLTWDRSTDDLGVKHYVVRRNGELVGTAKDGEFIDINLDAETSYLYEVVAVDVADKTSAAVSIQATTLIAPPLGTGTGAFARYYNTSDFNQRVLTRTDATIDFDWGTGEPATGVDKDTFSVVWEFDLQPLYPGEEYTLYGTFDDLGFIWIDDVLMFQKKSGTITLPTEEGKVYRVRVAYQESYSNALARLEWSSQRQLRSVIPSTQMYPVELPQGNQLSISSPEYSRVSPAWVHGVSGLGTDDIQVSASTGDEVTVNMLSETTWYVTTDNAAPAPVGITLSSTESTSMTFTAVGDGSAADPVTKTFSWVPTIVGKEGEPTELTIRQGDSLLLGSDAEAGQEVAVDYNYDGSVFAPTFNGEYEGYSTHVFAVPGSFTVRSVVTVLGEEEPKVGELTVHVVGVDISKSIPCEKNFTRKYTPTVLPASTTANVTWASASPTDLFVSKSGSTAEKLDIRPLTMDRVDLVAHLGGIDGPIIAKRPVDTFYIGTTASNSILVLEEYEDGSMLSQAFIRVYPKITDATIKVNIFKSGVTFEDSTIVKEWDIDEFYLHDAELDEYRLEFLIMSPPTLQGGTCYRLKAYQDGVHVGGTR